MVAIKRWDYFSPSIAVYINCYIAGEIVEVNKEALRALRIAIPNLPIDYTSEQVIETCKIHQPSETESPEFEIGIEERDDILNILNDYAETEALYQEALQRISSLETEIENLQGMSV